MPTTRSTTPDLPVSKSRLFWITHTKNRILCVCVCVLFLCLFFVYPYQNRISLICLNKKSGLPGLPISKSEMSKVSFQPQINQHFTCAKVILLSFCTFFKGLQLEIAVFHHLGKEQIFSFMATVGSPDQTWQQLLLNTSGSKGIPEFTSLASNRTHRITRPISK